MESKTIYVAGPVLRKTPDYRHYVLLKFFYRQLEAEAKLAEVRIQIPYHDKEVDSLDATEFAREIRRRIQAADALLVVIFDPHWHSGQENYSVACEAQIAADEGKPIAVVAQDPEQVPRLLRALAFDREIAPMDTADFQKIFKSLLQIRKH
jgi:hypothetical protein